MYLSAKAVFNDKTKVNTALLIRMETEIPADFTRIYKQNALKVTPRGQTNRLVRSIITQATKGRGEISWRAPYAAAQNEGGHNVYRKVVGTIKPGNPGAGEFGIIPAGFYPYSNGAKGFAGRAFRQTQLDMIPLARQRGYTK